MDPAIARLWHQAETQLSQRNAADARATYEAIVAREPRHAPAWLRLSTVASLTGRFRDSVAAALSASAAPAHELLLRADICERLLEVGESKISLDPERVAREALDFCGLAWEPACVAIEERTSAVATASTVQVREPIHQRSLGQWKRYEQWLEPLRQALGG